jgi:hypothetical protein
MRDNGEMAISLDFVGVSLAIIFAVEVHQRCSRQN